MLHFFRKIRRDLLANSQFFKYLKYAIGEIILVVLGILIALYINNQNQQRKEQERINKIIAEVETELATNIGVSRVYIEEFAKVDSAYLKLFIDSLKFEDYSYYNDRLFNYPVWPAINVAHKKLDETIGLNEKQESLRKELWWTYTVAYPSVRKVENEFYQTRKKNHEKFMIYDWYASWKFRKFDDERIMDFFANNPEYLKIALENFQLFSCYRITLQRFEWRGVKAYKRLYNYLDSLGIKHSDSLEFDYDPKEYKHYLGKYSSKWSSNKNYIHDDSITVSLEDGRLIWNGYRSDRPDTRSEITPINKYRFRDDKGGLYHVEFDEHGEVEGVRYSGGPGFTLDIEKIR